MSDRHDEHKAKIRAVDGQHRGWYGYCRITAAIRGDGRLVNHKTVQRLMSEMGMKSRVRPKKFRSYRGELGEAAPSALNRKFTASQANQKWVADVTEFGVAGKKLYLSPVMELSKGEIIAYQTSRRPDFSLVMNMLKKAARKCREMDRPLLHSDQGWHYRMQPYRAALAPYGMKQSMSRKEKCFDNAAMESFFATLKAEYFYLSDFGDSVPWTHNIAVRSQLAVLKIAFAGFGEKQTQTCTRKNSPGAPRFPEVSYRRHQRDNSGT